MSIEKESYYALEGMASKMEATMETLRVATLHIALGISHVYHVVYTAHEDGGAIAIPSKIYGQAKLQTLLKQLEIPANEIDVTMVMVESRMSYTLDLRHIDKDTVTNLLRRYAGA